VTAKKKPKRRRRRKAGIQTHHICYEPEVLAKMWTGEHWIMGQLLRRKKVSAGFVKCVKLWLWFHKHDAVDLEK